MFLRAHRIFTTSRLATSLVVSGVFVAAVATAALGRWDQKQHALELEQTAESSAARPARHLPPRPTHRAPAYEEFDEPVVVVAS